MKNIINSTQHTCVRLIVLGLPAVILLWYLVSNLNLSTNRMGASQDLLSVYKPASSTLRKDFLNTSCYPTILTDDTASRMADDKELLRKLKLHWKSAATYLKAKETLYSRQNSAVSRFLPSYKNPCWLEDLPDPITLNKSNYNPGRSHAYDMMFSRIKGINSARYASGARTRVRCLPYVFIAGVMKSGTSDLKNTLTKHPEVAFGSTTHFLRMKEYDRNNQKTLEHYLEVFDDAADRISKTFTRLCSTGEKYHPEVIFEQEEGLLFSFNRAYREGQSDDFRQLHALQFLVPQVKILLMLRNPTDRLYSSFKQYTPLTLQSPQKFHETVTKQIALFHTCLENHTLTYCMYPNKIHPMLRSADPRRSLYYGYLSDLMNIFSKEQIHAIKAEEFFTNRAKEMRAIVKFLRLMPLDKTTEERINKSPATNGASHRYAVRKVKEPAGMLEETKKMLNLFYEPWNKRLAELLNDRRFLWK